MVDHAGGDFDQHDTLLERVRHGPGSVAAAELTTTTARPAPCRWTLRTIRASIAEVHDYSLSGVWRVLTRNRVGVRTALVRRYSPDPAYRMKEDTLLQCLLEAAQAPRPVVVVFLDEMGYTRWPDGGSDWDGDLPEAAPERRTHGTNTQGRIIGALNALNGQVSYLDSYIVGRRQVIAMYQRLSATYAWADRLYVVQDNWSIHRHEDVLVALHYLPQITPVWLPTYAPWLNPIEKLWRWLRQDTLKMHRLAADWPALQQQVRSFLDQFAHGSHALLHYVGLRGDGKLAQAIRPP
jgi:hypothetical protein